MSKFASRHNESDLTCTSPGGLREHMLDFHETLRTPRNMNIEHVKSDFFVEVYKKEPKSDEMDIQ